MMFKANVTMKDWVWLCIWYYSQSISNDIMLKYADKVKLELTQQRWLINAY